jgi:H+/Cl- antiporter ClcA
MNHMLRKIGRLFVIKTRFEAWLVIYAIALGAVERGRHYLETYPGYGGWLLALACTGVVFIAGAKLLDSVRPQAPATAIGAYAAPVQRRSVTGRSRPRRLPTRRDLTSRISRRRG